MTGYVASLCAITDMIEVGKLGYLQDYVFVMRHLTGDRMDVGAYYLDESLDFGEMM